MKPSVEITPELMAGFLDEAPEYLDMLDAGLMEFEAKAGSDVIALETEEDVQRMNEMFRAAHSLKGLAAAFGFEKIKVLTHNMETLFDHVRMRKRNLTAASIEILFAVFDRLKALVQELVDESGDEVQISDIIGSLEALLTSNEGVVGSAGSTPGESSPSPASEQNTVALPDTTEVTLPVDAEMVSLFIETTREAIEELNASLLGLEQDPTSEDLLNRTFRCAHNIKGASGAVGLIGMNRLTHQMETVLDDLRNARIALDDELSTALFQAADRLRSVVDQLHEGRQVDIAEQKTNDLFERWISADIAPVTRTAATTEVTAATEGLGVADVPNGDSDIGLDEPPTLLVTVTFPENFEEAAIQAYLIHNKLCELGDVVKTEPDLDTLAADSSITRLVFELESDLLAADIEEIVKSYTVSNATVAPAGPERSTATETAPVSQASQPGENAPAQGDGESGTPVVDTPVVAPGAAAQPSSKATSTPSAAPTASTAKVAGSPASADSVAPSGGAGKKEGGKGAKSDAPVAKKGETLRVDQERLDHLMNLGGELVINKARFVEIHSRFRDVFDGKNRAYLVDEMEERLNQLDGRVDKLRAESGGSSGLGEVTSDLRHLRDNLESVSALVRRVHDARAAMQDFDEALHGLGRVSESLQKGIMGTRMVAIGPLFTRFRRVVRDIAKGCGKRVNLVLHGEHTELDKRMIDELGDPLTHMVRNGVDHGIEMPDVRAAAGKDETGTLILSAYHRGNSICIEVTDDGAGINLERVRAKVLEKELATPTQVEKMSDRELCQFVLKPGFSTAEKVTDLSGRGMGMDIVMAKLEQLNGAIEIDSTPGKGSRITIKLPLTLAIMTSMVTRIGKQVYCIPLEAVAEIITIRQAEIQMIQRRRVARIRDRVVPIALFEDIFGTQSAALQTVSKNDDELTLIIIGFENNQLGLVVEELLGQEDVVIKSIDENYRNVRGIAGASIRGDGTISLILDVGAMIEMAGDQSAPGALCDASSGVLATVDV